MITNDQFFAGRQLPCLGLLVIAGGRELSAVLLLAAGHHAMDLVLGQGCVEDLGRQ